MEEHFMSEVNTRRTALKSFGIAAGAALLAANTSANAATATDTSLIPTGAADIKRLSDQLLAAPRRRSFKTVPMILNRPDQWDSEALTEVLTYRGERRQVWDNTDIGSPWLNLMRNSLNAQLWAFKHPNSLMVSATHGTAHLALFDQTMWDKYGFTSRAGDKFKNNSLILATPDNGSSANYEQANGVYSPHENNIPTLQRRGVVFLACHNAIWEISEALIAANNNPDKLSQEALAAELTNRLIPGAVLTPGVVGTIAELQHAGYSYAK
jgi:intracellular sulfur oxidation DsrE/DsrF family protein